MWGAAVKRGYKAGNRNRKLKEIAQQIMNYQNGHCSHNF